MWCANSAPKTACNTCESYEKSGKGVIRLGAKGVEIVTNKFRPKRRIEVDSNMLVRWP